MILVIDTSTAACSIALIEANGTVVASHDETIGRGHAERLVPMIEDLISGHVPTQILVGVGPGSFTGLRVGIAAAHGLSIGWDVPLCGVSSLALIAAGAPGEGPVAAVIAGGHGELFAQAFDRDPLRASGALLNRRPDDLGELDSIETLVGNGAETLREVRGHGVALDLSPKACLALGLPEALRTLDPKPLYARAPDAKPASIAA